MTNILNLLIIFLILPVFLLAEPKFEKYWHDGKAEINSYQLEIPRYREIRTGTATLIYVTEDFLADKQVKLELPPKPSISILKLNKIIDFQTGVYPYHAMQSIFSPVKKWELIGKTYPAVRPIKSTLAMTEWCGNFYSQINTRNNQINYLGHSYFEHEADSQKILKLHTDGILEDDLFIRTRELIEEFKSGDYKMLTSNLYARFRHQLPLWVRAKVTKRKLEKKYKIADQYYQANLFTITTAVRNYRIYIEQDYPRKILAWEVDYLDQGDGLTEKAALVKSIRSDYWNLNANGDHLKSFE